VPDPHGIDPLRPAQPEAVGPDTFQNKNEVSQDRRAAPTIVLDGPELPGRWVVIVNNATYNQARLGLSGLVGG